LASILVHQTAMPREYTGWDLLLFEWVNVVSSDDMALISTVCNTSMMSAILISKAVAQLGSEVRMFETCRFHSWKPQKRFMI